MQKKVKYKIKPVPVAILCASIVLVIVGIVGLVSGFGNNDDGNPTIDISPVGSQAQSIYSPTKPETVKVTVNIGMGDCILTTDQIVKVTVNVEPSNTDTAVIWKSSDESVMTVTEDGVISAKKAGVSALTATVGNVTDAIVVKWVTPENSGSSTEPVNPHIGGGQVITPLQPERPTQGQSQGQSQGSTQGATQGTIVSPTVTPSQGSSQAPTTKPTSPVVTPTMSPTTAPSQGSTQAPTIKPTSPTTTPTVAPTVAPIIVPTVVPTQAPSVDVEGLKSTELYTVLPGMGFTRLYSNVYSYGNTKDNYCGQVIIEPNQATIYVATRNTEFDNAIKNVLASMLPESADAVWRSYVGAGSDTTFMVGLRKVRIVTAKNGGHSQIVVWN